MEQVLDGILHDNKFFVERAGFSNAASPAAKRAIVTLVLALEELENVIELDLPWISCQRTPPPRAT